MFCHCSILQASHFVSSRVSSLMDAGARLSLTSLTRGPLWCYETLSCCVSLLFPCRWMSCSGNMQCPFLAFQRCHFEARVVNVSPGRWVRLTPHRTCSFTQLNHRRIHSGTLLWTSVAKHIRGCMPWYDSPAEVHLQFKAESTILSLMHVIKYNIPTFFFLIARHLKIYQG